MLVQKCFIQNNSAVIPTAGWSKQSEWINVKMFETDKVKTCRPVKIKMKAIQKYQGFLNTENILNFIDCENFKIF